MKLAILTPLPPVKSGIAHYSATLLPELARRHDVTVVVDQDEVDTRDLEWIRFEEFEQHPESFDAVICQLGNNPFHAFAWRWARTNPSIVVLHEVVLHHLLVEQTLARGDAEGLVRELTEEYGEVGRAVAEARVAGLHGELANFMMPASSRLAESSKHVIVHNHWAKQKLVDAGVTTPIAVVQHPFDPPPSFDPDEIDSVKRAAGWSTGQRIVGTFGFVTDAKRPEVVMEASSLASQKDDMLRLVFVGEPAPNIDLNDLASRFGVRDDRWQVTGYVTNREFDLWLNVVNRVVALRYPTAGESSGPIVRTFAVGRPIAVSDYAQFAEFPDELAVRIPFESEVESVADFMIDPALAGDSIGAAQRNWLESNATVVHTADGYDAVLSSGDVRGRSEVEPGQILPLFPNLDARLIDVAREERGVSVVVRLTNRGDATLPCALWGEPAYLLRARGLADDGTRHDLTVELDRDLRSGESTEVAFLFEKGVPSRIELRHSLACIPDRDDSPFATLEPVE